VPGRHGKRPHKRNLLRMVALLMGSSSPGSTTSRKGMPLRTCGQQEQVSVGAGLVLKRRRHPGADLSQYDARIEPGLCVARRYGHRDERSGSSLIGARLLSEVYQMYTTRLCSVCKGSAPCRNNDSVEHRCNGGIQ